MKLLLPTLVALSASLAAQVPALDPAGLEAALKSGGWTLVEFGGPTCVPCRNMQPILAGLQQHYGGRVQFRNFHVTQFPREARPHKVMAMPTQILFDPAGREVMRHIGFWERGDFLAALAKAGLK